MVHRLANLPGGWTGTVYMEYTEPSAVAGQLKEREVQLSASEMLKASKGMIQSYSNQQEVAAVQSQRMAMETIGQTPVFIRFFVMRTAADDETLERRVRDLESLLTTLGISAFPARYTQRALWQSTLPTAEMVLKQKPRNMTPQSMATFFWPAQRRYMDDTGIYVGIDEETQLPIRVDPFGEYKEKTPTFLALGRPGAGKSVWLRSMMLSALVAGNNVMAVDIEGEMQTLCDRYGGRYIEIGGRTGERINVLDIPPDSENPLEHGTKHLVAFCEAVRGRAIPKGPEWNALAEAYRLALEDRQLIDAGTGRVTREWQPEDAPLLKDIARILANSRRAEAASLAEMLHPYADGLYKEYFNTPTTFDIRSERLVVFGMRSANESGTWDDQELQVYLWQVMGLMWSEVLRRNEARPEVANHVMLDEVWALLRTPGGAAAIENMARRFRKRRGALWMASQQIGEFLEKEHGRQILSVVGAKLLMGVSPFEAKRMQGPFELSEYYIDMLTQLGHGEGLLQLANAMLKVWIRIPQDLGIY
jgi:type IV secretory pathway VirB4 component